MKTRLCSLLTLFFLLLAVPAAGQPMTTDDYIAAVENGLVPILPVPGAPETATMAERMAYHRVPGVSIAVIDDGEIAWTHTWGVRDLSNDAPVTPETAFQVASISKAVSASGVLMLVDSGAIALDTDVNEYLTSWSVPESEYTATEAVTMRRLLSHMSGTPQYGLSGYEIGAPLPTLLQILNGEAPAKNPAVVIDHEPGSNHVYSNIGYEVVQLVAEDVTSVDFAGYMMDHVLSPIGMEHSQYRTPLGDDVAFGYLLDGSPVPGGWYVYPEDAAASLWSTPTDLARWALEIRRAYHGESYVLSQEIAHEMLERVVSEQGLGPALMDVPGDFAFWHSGANIGYRGLVVLMRESGDGVAILTNSDGGQALWHEILSAVANVYEWPGSHVRQYNRHLVVLDDIEKYAGLYHGTFDVTLTVDVDRVQIHLPKELGSAVVTYFPESEVRFFDIYNDLNDATFELAEDGSVTGFRTFVPELGLLEFAKVDD